jgi:hypothetical protein
MTQSEYESIIYGQHGYIIWGVVFVLIAFLGCIGNILTILVLKRDSIVSTLNILLIALAISDILAPQANTLLAILFYHLENNYSDSVYYLIFSDILRHIIQPLSTMFTMVSSWIVTLTTLFRLIAVMFPFKARTLINRKCALVCLFFIFSFSLASILPIYFSLVRRVKCTRDFKSQYVAFEMQVTSELMAKVYVPMIQTMCFYLPWLLSLTLWLFLLRTLKRSEKNFNVSLVSKDTTSVMSPLFTPNQNINNNNKKSVFSFAETDKNISRKKSRYSADSLSSTVNNHHPNLNLQHSTTLSSDSRMNNAQTRKKSYNRITLMVVVLCLSNLICRIFTFVFVFEVIYDEYAFKKREKILSEYANSTTDTDTIQLPETARIQFPKFLSYSLLLNNIFLCVNHSSNIFIYIFTNPRFKANLLCLFRNSFLCRVFNKKLSPSASDLNNINDYKKNFSVLKEKNYTNMYESFKLRKKSNALVNNHKHNHVLKNSRNVRFSKEKNLKEFCSGSFCQPVTNPSIQNHNINNNNNKGHCSPPIMSVIREESTIHK